MHYIDMHCDTLAAALAQKKDTVYELKSTMADVRRLCAAGAGAQFFAMFLPQRDMPEWFGCETMPQPETLIAQMYRIYCNTMEQYSDIVAPARSLAEYRNNRSQGKLSAFLTVENGYPVSGRLEELQKWYDMGVRLVTLTWNDANCFGMCHSALPQQMMQGLTDFGKEAVRYMNELGMLVDVSHLSDGGFYDVAECSTKPFVASHSNCRQLCPATRNLTDEMIRLLAEKGGVAGVNFAPAFINVNPMDTHMTISALCAHIEHLRQIGGEECVGIGTDFDGIEGTFEIEDCSSMGLLFDELHRRGYPDDFIDKAAFGNVERVIGDVMRG